MRFRFLLPFAILIAPLPSSAATLAVAVEGVRSAKGGIRAGVYDATGKQIATGLAPAAKGRVLVRIAAVPAGAYAVKLYHDENGDGRMDRKLFGLPAEGYGFSNRARVRFGVPSFAAMRVEVGDTDVETAATLSY